MYRISRNLLQRSLTPLAYVRQLSDWSLCTDRRPYEARKRTGVMTVDEGFADVTASYTDDQIGDQSLAVSASFEVYVATRSRDVQDSTTKLLQCCARSALWTVVADSFAASFGMGPCRMHAALMLRRSGGKISAAIAARNWSVILVGEEAFVDVAATNAVAASLVGTPVREKIEIPFLSPALTVRATTKLGEFHRFYCN